MTENNQLNQEEKQKEDNIVFNLNIKKGDLDLVYKYLLRVDLKGFEVPEMNRIFIALDPKTFKKVE